MVAKVGSMNINDLCGIAVTISALTLLAMFAALIGKLNYRPKRESDKQTEA